MTDAIETNEDDQRRGPAAGEPYRHSYPKDSFYARRLIKAGGMAATVASAMTLFTGKNLGMILGALAIGTFIGGIVLAEKNNPDREVSKAEAEKATGQNAATNMRLIQKELSRLNQAGYSDFPVRMDDFFDTRYTSALEQVSSENILELDEQGRPKCYPKSGYDSDQTPVSCGRLIESRILVNSLERQYGFSGETLEWKIRPANGENCFKGGNPVKCRQAFEGEARRQKVLSCVTKIDPRYTWTAHEDTDFVQAYRTVGNKAYDVSYNLYGPKEETTIRGISRDSKGKGPGYYGRVKACQDKNPLPAAPRITG